MNFFMFLAPALLIVGLFGLYDNIRLFRRNGVVPADSRLYRWFALLLILVIPVRNFQEEFQLIKVAYYILIPIVLIWLFYVHFREGKAYLIVDSSENELITKVEQLFKTHKVRLKKEKQDQEEFSVLYKLGDTEATAVIKRSKDSLNETNDYSYILTFKKWWKLQNSEIIIDELIRNLKLERKPIHFRKRKLITFGYLVIFIVGTYLAMNTF
ncbi:hypothetical protein AWH56_016315 [Anaerobacillus isosaccharinicus]|uniref:Uncharacterized protein n=1 Tax=Anaerobacillus isosaccharinicus TaxID=1532552 RepID=A0A1S2M1L5_9BACI|nr:hypothetical protein [Anaerobacillus isosaccharinicus]MBA5587534.1 hypothetical protein [Anaerobacillus isosaccharinicus]QOY34286.1 hypothetical protein AWH56_016315 [Anaerobacillus isosaccharinicus]